MTLPLSQGGMVHSTLAYLEMLPGLGFHLPLPSLQVSWCCAGNQCCVRLDVGADSLQLSELGRAAVATSVPLVEQLCSEVMNPLHGILLNYILHLDFSDFWGVFWKV